MSEPNATASGMVTVLTDLRQLIDDPPERDYYITLSRLEHWSVRQMNRCPASADFYNPVPDAL